MSGIWKHVKTERLYRIVAVGKMEADHTPIIVYRDAAIYDGDVWVRPASEFYDGRFVRVDSPE